MPRGLELLIAQTILQGFDAQYGRFLEVTSGAQQRFEHADWHAVQQACVRPSRIHRGAVYRDKLSRKVPQLCKVAHLVPRADKC
jgi:isocitrate dehydrogenase kinase/phosphatase